MEKALGRQSFAERRDKVQELVAALGGARKKQRPFENLYTGNAYDVGHLGRRRFRKPEQVAGQTNVTGQCRYGS